MVLLKAVVSRGLSLFTDGLEEVLAPEGGASSRRRIGTVPIALFFLLFTIHCSLFTAVAFAEEKVYLINIEGMHCKMCVHRVTKSLKKLKEVREVEVNLDDGTATVLLNDGMDLKPEELEEAVKDAGYEPVGIK